MAETANIATVAEKISKDIFKHFLWKTHPLRDDNFACCNSEHRNESGNSKQTHPGDVVFFYDDPYKEATVYLHTDLKSYKESSINSNTLRKAFQSLCMTIECANESDDWRQKYSISSDQKHEVRGLLFVHNHDNGHEDKFDKALENISFSNLPVASGTYIHFFGPKDIQRLYTIGNEIIRLKSEEIIPNNFNYTFFYPDLVIVRRHAEIWNQSATIESLTGPYLILKYHAFETNKPGYVIFYNRNGAKVEEFEYFIDMLSRYQLLNSENDIHIRVTSLNPDENINSNFETAKKKYSKSWGFDPVRIALLDEINLELVTCVTSTYNPGFMGWRVSE